MADYAALKAYSIANALLTDLQIVAAVNTAQIVSYGFISITSIVNYLATVKKLQSFITWATNPPVDASVDAVDAAKNLLFAIDHPGLIPGWNLADTLTWTTVTGFIDALIASGSTIPCPITATDKTNLLALASSYQTQAEAWGWSSAGITANDVIAARAMP